MSWQKTTWLLVFVSLFCASRAFEWEPNSIVNETVNVCTHGNATFDWSYKGPGRILSVDLNFTAPGNASRTIASYVHDNFLTNSHTDKYETVQGKNAALKILNVGKDDEGNYTVTVTILPNDGQLKEEILWAVLHVDELPQLINGALQITVDTMHGDVVRLKCGQFVEQSHETVPVDWSGPNGTITSNLPFKQGYFYLDLTSPPEDSSYTCALNMQGSACSSSSAIKPGELVFNPMDARLKMIEHRLEALELRCPGGTGTTVSPSLVSAAPDGCAPDQVSALTRQLRDVQAANDHLKGSLESMNKSLSSLEATLHP